MKHPETFIYFGLFFLLLGIGDNHGEIIPFEIKIFSGFALISYGILLHFQKNKSLEIPKFGFKLNWKELNSKSYFIIGIVLAKIDDLSNFFDDRFWLAIYINIVGVALICYGLNLHFKEKKNKRESGNIEKT